MANPLRQRSDSLHPTVSAVAGVVRSNGTGRVPSTDYLAKEEPLEIRIVFEQNNVFIQETVSVTLRSPGKDRELAVGFLYSEGIFDSVEDIASVEHGTYARYGDENRITCTMKPGVAVDIARLHRHLFTTSSCGVCGKTSLEAVRAISKPIDKDNQIRIETAFLQSVPARLLTSQNGYHETGGMHAAAWMNTSGNEVRLAEDVGRHNAVDKVIGGMLLSATHPSGGVLAVSGRAGFELVHKAARMGIAVFTAIGAPSDLAVDLARQMNITLIGFLREDRFNIYSCPERIT